jgi:hypothetical protein
MTEVHRRTRALLDRVAAAADADGRLGFPDIAGWDIFPFEGELLVKPLQPLVLPEPLREGEGGTPCGSCAAGLDDAIWTDDRWKLVAPREASIPIVLLCPLEHLDLVDLDASYAAELGLLTVRLEKALTALGGVGRVHAMKVGDGALHLHVWFFARPAGLLQLRGSSLVDWSDCLPPMPTEEWDAVQRELAAGLAASGGRALV